MRTETECIESLREAAEQLGKSPTKAQYEELGLTPASGTIQRVMGGWNAAKEAAGLETNPSRGSRVQAQPDDIELPDGMEWTELSQAQRWHYKNREWNTERTLQRRQRLRRWIHERKDDSEGCSHCSETDPACLDFHHQPGVEKEMAINKMVPYGYSKSDIEAEIEKCELLCANCHTREHASRTETTNPDESSTKEQRLRQWSREYKRNRGYRRCSIVDPVCLQFHHVEEKRMGIGEMITNSCPESEIRTEVQKCIVLCANCHRKEHYEIPETAAGESDRI